MRFWPRTTGGIAVWATALALVASVGCKKSSSNPDASVDGPKGDGIVITDVATETRDLGPETPPCVAGTKAKGDACGCNAECTGGHCVDGVCCDSACTEGCKTCAAAGMLGTCVNRTLGSNPRDSTTCKASAVSTCGLDGKCDGIGGCSKYPVNTVCKAGTCEGDAVIGANVCDGLGQCKPGSTRICVPFSCNQGTGACFTTCTTNSQCVSGHQCVGGSCGPRMKGASCEKPSDCASGFCADGVCCNVACAGPCLSCNLMGREGTCWALDADLVDTRKICQDMGPTTCGQNGLCDGVGSCSKYPRDTVCKAATCSGNRRNTPGTCDGFGTCSAPGIQNCNPFRCANGACTNTCETNADCDIGIACVLVAGVKTCGPRQDGQNCQASSECQHGHCVDGVCCDQACAGACRSCKLDASLGRCMPIAAGTVDPRNVCTLMPQSTCGTNGKCDGSGGCQSWPPGTLCASETCNPTGNVYTAPSTCNAAGQCVALDPVACSPYKCNGTRCFNACTADNQCVSPYSCTLNSCGPKEPGASCSANDECRSLHCAQGVCCDQACDTACKSCIVGVLGTCSNVATGLQDPSGLCVMQAQSTCGINGRCEAGACQKWAAGTPCMNATCPSTTNASTPQSTCNGAGTCVTPATSACFPYRCDTSACFASCSSNAQCQPPAACVNGFCGLQPNGAICANKDECLSANCEQGVCCETACTGVCKSCALPQSRGTCSNIPDGGSDTGSRCADQGGPSCGTDGFCNGAGACRLYVAGTSCASPSCPTGQSTAVSGRACNGLGVCQPATTQPCAPYVCNGTTACFSVCTGDQDCQLGNICDPQTSHCGNLRRRGQACASTSECLTGDHCVDGVCCGTSSCPLCQACNVGTSAGTCSNVPLGNPDTMNRCTPNPPCGNTGFCNGAGGCQLAATTVSCGTQSCTGSTFTPLSNCNGIGGCAAPTAANCTPYICGTNACMTSCTVDTDCQAPYTCQGVAPKSCARKPLGQACTAGNQCISGNCVNSVCCGTAVCGTCEACNLNSLGTCAPIALGTPAPGGQCAASPPCGNTGRCDGASGCQQAATNTSCGAPISCTGTTFQAQSFCTGGGSCNQAATSSCGNYVCGVNACLTTCTADSDCSSTSLYCTGDTTTPGSCVAKKANGATCVAAKECAIGNCVDGVCCATSSCPACQTCSLSGNGTCSNVADNNADPPNCAPNPPCGNTGVCVAGACQQAATTVTCGAPVSCTGTTYQPLSHCTGSGTCNQLSTSSCGNYVCGTNMCLNSCTADADCSSAGLYCTGNTTTPGSCVGKKANGATCGASHECSLGNCVDGVCCATSSCPSCQSCSLNGSGTCSDVPSGMADPPNCAANPPCGNTGFCDGNGGCLQALASTGCGLSQSCTGTTYQPPSYCSGTGTCSQTTTSSCGNYLCSGSSCLTTCTSDSDCSSTNLYCNGDTTTPGSCAAKNANGVACGAGHECLMGNCVDSVCCSTSGCGTCQACNVNANGICADVPDGQAEPHGGCGPNGNCGNTGFCALGACTQVAAGTMCSGFFCPGPGTSTFQPGGSCNGAGTCVIPSSVDCSPYKCTTGSCFSQCTADSQCVSTAYCTGDVITPGSCVSKLVLGDPCVEDRQCAMGHCTEGVCCDVGACSSPCMSCKVNLLQGTCNYVPPGGLDPMGTCTTEGPTSCGTTGFCNGGGNCQVYDVNTECMTSCDGMNFTHTFCDGGGMCIGAMVTDTCPTSTCTSAGCDP